MPAPRYPHAFLLSDEQTVGVQRRPAPAEAAALDEYRRMYREAVGYPPHGLHYLPLPGAPATVPVFFTLPAD